jgi:EAL domain-containing protein (putative c-di-GMP-specific phosphodiesterase class I)
MTVHGEGAETVEEVGILKELGCDLVQGYFFARPGVADDALAFARRVEGDACRAIAARKAHPKAAA